MSVNSVKSKAAALTQLRAIIAGIEKHFPNGSFTLGGTAYTTATLTQALQNLANALSALNAAHVQVKDAEQTLKGVQAKTSSLVGDTKRFVLAAFASSPQQLADFGLQAPKAKQPLSSEKRAAAVAKAKATRIARGTTSKKQKLAVKGDVTSVKITPVTEPASPTQQAPATPAGSTTAAAAPGGATK